MTLAQQLHKGHTDRAVSEDPNCPICNPKGFRSAAGRFLPRPSAAQPPYRVPLGTFIGQGRTTRLLYDLERDRDRAIRHAADELGRILGLENFYREILPEALLSVLEGWDVNAARLAAQAYLAKHPEAK